MPRRLQPFANRRANPALPNNRVCDRLPSRFFPQDGCLTLIRNANRRDVLGGGFRLEAAFLWSRFRRNDVGNSRAIEEQLPVKLRRFEQGFVGSREGAKTRKGQKMGCAVIAFSSRLRAFA